MAKRGQRQPYRTLYVFDAGNPAPWSVERRGTIVAGNLFDALAKARAPFSAVAAGRAETCTVTIVHIADDRSRNTLYTITTAEDLETAITANL